MAIYDREFEAVTQEELTGCLKFCLNRLQLRDWEVTLIDGCSDSADPELGSMHLDEKTIWKHRAKIYVSMEQHEKRNMNPFSTICHEVIHLLVNGKCHLDCPKDFDEYIAWTFEDLLYQEFCRATKRKPTKINEELR